MTTTTMSAHRARAVVGADGTLTLSGLPLKAGDEVEVIVLVQPQATGATADPRYPLRGKPYRFDNLDEPAVPIEDWEVYRCSDRE